MDLQTSERAQAFREMADKLQTAIDDKLAPRQTNTARKVRMAEQAESEGRRLKVLQDKLRAIADGLDDLTLPDDLQAIRTLVQVETLLDHPTCPTHETAAKRLRQARINAANYEAARAALLGLGDPSIGDKTEVDPAFASGLPDDELTDDTIQDLIEYFDPAKALPATVPGADALLGELDNLEPDPTPATGDAAMRERITFVLAYPISVITQKGSGLTKDWGQSQLELAREIETANKNRKTVLKWIERRLSSLEHEPDEISVEDEQRVADAGVICEVCQRHRSLYELETGLKVCAICEADLDRAAQKAAESTSDPTPTQVPLLPETPPAPPTQMFLPVTHLRSQVEHVPDPPTSFVNSLRRVQLVPIQLRQRDGKKLIVDGRRRVKALLIIHDERAEDDPSVLVRAEVYDGDAWTHDAVMAIKANAERSPNTLNELQHIESLLGEGYTEKQIAEATGMPLATIRKRLKLTRLAPDLRAALDEGRIKPTVAEKAVHLPADQQAELAAQDGRITGSDVAEVRQVQVKESIDLWPEHADPTPAGEAPTPVSARVSGPHLLALIESSEGAIRELLMELRDYRARYGAGDSYASSQEPETHAST